VGPTLPHGTVTFLFTDVEGSTRLLQELGPDAYSEALSEHRRLVRAAFARNGGVEVDTQGDAFLVAFPTAPGAADAAREICTSLEATPIVVRIGIHTGTPLATSEGYVGLDLHRASRIAAAGHGGQILVSASTAALLGEPLRDLGEHRFKDLAAAERVYQLGGGEFPPLRSLRNVQLPIPATPFLGRERELESVVALLTTNGIRLLTLTGPGGTGKTRLALQAAAETADAQRDGVWWVPLAPLRDPALVVSAVAQALGLREEAGRTALDSVTAEFGERRPLLLLDNAEHLLPDAAHTVAELVARTRSTLLVTSRERLHVQGEHVYPVPTLAEQDGMQLFVTRARSIDPSFASNQSVPELCARLDQLPLALELAAARTTLFSPQQLLERVAARLDLLKGGRDTDPRQQTLRATIEWSYDLLSGDEQRLFRSLAVFADGCSYEAAETVVDVDPDTLQSLIDKSLLRRRDTSFGSRYWMLETIREYAAERLEKSGEADVMRQRHAKWCAQFAENLIGLPGEQRDLLGVWAEEAQSRLESENRNLQAALAWAWDSGSDELALRLGAVCSPAWVAHARFSAALAWLDRADETVAFAALDVQLEALKAAGIVAFFALADPGRADVYWARALELAQQLGRLDDIPWIEQRRAGVLWAQGDLERALALHERELEHARAQGARSAEWSALHLLGEVLRDLGRFDEAERALLEADAIGRDLGGGSGVAANTHSLADLALDRGDLDGALRLYRQSISDAGSDRPLIGVFCAAGVASVLAELGGREDAARLWGAVSAAEEHLGFRILGSERSRYERRLAQFEGTESWHSGRTLSLEQAVAAIEAIEERRAGPRTA
jgi:predicted ATPase